MGQVLNRASVRGLMCCIVLPGVITYHLTTRDHCFLGRYAGGLFIYAISVMDAHRNAAIKFMSAR